MLTPAVLDQFFDVAAGQFPANGHVRRPQGAGGRAVRRFAFEPLEERRVLSGLSPVATTALTPQSFWSEQLATGSALRVLSIESRYNGDRPRDYLSTAACTKSHEF